MNRTILVGRLTKDPELRYTQQGTAVANFNLAVDRPFKKDGQATADFVNCVAWRAPAENLANYMKKGSRIGVDGRIQTRSYEDKDGKNVFVTEVVADNIQFLETKSEGNQQSNNRPAQNNQQNNDPFAGNGEPIDIDDSDLPF
ncbi:single-stranded DNA-binding protein [Microbulbifer pacificus]|uniref:single-stranded DNA-binding protein n=1 Tax=Microbulbifer pacificus TaxID=407164 RepID=UPI000CF4B8CB|nr:single-stranded DNA-binding protein [Microbulbifer pacificus]